MAAKGVHSSPFCGLPLLGRSQYCLRHDSKTAVGKSGPHNLLALVGQSVQGELECSILAHDNAESLS